MLKSFKMNVFKLTGIIMLFDVDKKSETESFRKKFVLTQK